MSRHFFPDLKGVLGPAIATSMHADERSVGASLQGPADEIGRLNLITHESRRGVLVRVGL